MASSRAMRRLIRAILVVGAVLALLLAGVVAFIEPLVRFGLQVAGLEDVRFQQLSLGPGRLEVEGLEVGPAPGSRLDRLRIGFAWSELLRGRVEQVDIEGLELRGRIVDGRVELMGLETDAGEDAEAAWVPVPWPRRVSLDAARIEIDTAAGRLVLPLSGELRPAAAHADWSLAIDDARLVADPGTLARGDLELRGQVPLDRPLTLDAISAQGRLTLRADDASVPDVASGLSGAGELALALDQGRLEAETRDLRLEIETLGEALRPLGEALPAPWRLALGTDEVPLRLAATLAGDEIAVLLDGATRLVTAQPQAEASLALDLIAGQDGTLRAVRPSRATVELSALEWRDARLTRGRVELTASGAPDRLSGTIALEAAGEGAPMPGLTVNDAAIRQRVDVLIADGAMTLSLPEPALLQAASLAWQEDLRTGPLTLHLEGGDGPLLEADFADGALGAWQESLVARLEPVQVTVRTGGAPLALSVEADRLAVRLEGAGTELAQGHASLHAGRARLPEAALVLEGIDSEVVFDPAGLVPDQVIPVGIGAIRQERSPPWFAPLTASGTLRPTDGQLVFDASLRRIDGGVELQVAGAHELTSGRGRASVDLAPVTFSPGGLQPVALAPAHGDLLSEATGTLALDGSVRWQPGGTLGVDVALLIDQIGFGLGPARFEQVNGVVRFDQLWPLSTLPGQQLAVGLVDIGLPLTRGFATFRLQPDGTLAVEQLRWRAAGGIVRAEPFRIGSDASGITVILRAEGLDLAQIFALTRLDGLTGEGTINGALPIRISGGEAVVTGGELVATRPGRLRYRPAEPPAAVAAGGESMGLLLEALENFRYDALRITLDGRTDAAMDIGLHLKGANPHLYDGYPIEFNFALEGELANVLRQGLAGYQIPDQIQERMQSFPR